jgi:hypothetical protein
MRGATTDEFRDEFFMMRDASALGWSEQSETDSGPDFLLGHAAGWQSRLRRSKRRQGSNPTPAWSSSLRACVTVLPVVETTGCPLAAQPGALVAIADPLLDFSH